MRVEERLLKYVSYWTTSDEECRQIPSSERQFELGKVLEQELRDLGLEKVTLTDHCYVYGLLPATKGYADKPAVGFISHMDTAPDFSGTAPAHGPPPFAGRKTATLPPSLSWFDRSPRRRWHYRCIHRSGPLRNSTSRTAPGTGGRRFWCYTGSSSGECPG